MTNNFTSIRLRASALWFGMIAAILSFSVALATSKWLEMSGWAGLTLGAVLATTFSSILFWWLFIVRPGHISVLRGAEAGMVSIIAASFLMCWLSEAYGVVYSGVIQHQDIGALLVAAVLILSILGFPVQNSILSGTTRKPDQNGGRGIFPIPNRRAALATSASSSK